MDSEQSETDVLHAILTEIELTMRERLKEVGIDLPHLLVATGPSGNTLVLGAMDANTLKRVCSDLAERAELELRKRSADEVPPPTVATEP